MVTAEEKKIKKVQNQKAEIFSETENHSFRNFSPQPYYFIVSVRNMTILVS